MIKQNRQDAERLLERIVREKGEDTTAVCQYSSLETDPYFDFEYGKWQPLDGQPAADEVYPICIVGCAVYELGGVEALYKMPSDTIASNVAQVVDLFDEAATRYLRAAQWVQDNEGTWGEGLAIANSITDEELVEHDEGGFYPFMKSKLKEYRESTKG